jgi:hypothetical protein
MRISTVFTLLLCAAGSPALAGITVTSYSTTALTNGFAPSLQGPYLAQQTLENLTPALADVAGDWTGPNEDGTPNTWHWVGSSQASSTTTFDVNSYTVTAAGSFEYELDTTADFVDPASISVYSPGAGANYNGLFNTDVPVAYSIIGLLNEQARVRLNTLSGEVIFEQSNPTSVPAPVNLVGTIPAGQYRVLFTTGLGLGNLSNGIHHKEASGSFEDVIFTVQVPEPRTFGAGIAMVLGLLLRRSPKCNGAN